VIPEEITLAVSGQTTIFTVNGTVKAAGTVSVTDATIAGTGTIEATGTVAGMPKFTTTQFQSTDPNPANANWAISSTKNLATGRLDIKLYGTVTGVSGETGFSGVIGSDLWGPNGAGRPAGNWSWVMLDGAFPYAVASGSVLKITNQAWSYFKGSTDDAVAAIISQTPLTVPAENSAASIYISADNTDVYSWKKTTGVPKDDSWGVLLWSAASSKTATLEVTPVSGTGAYTVTLDWSGLTIN
jgi:hypothetical protein